MTPPIRALVERGCKFNCDAESSCNCPAHELYRRCLALDAGVSTRSSVFLQWANAIREWMSDGNHETAVGMLVALEHELRQLGEEAAVLREPPPGICQTCGGPTSYANVGQRGWCSNGCDLSTQEAETIVHLVLPEFFATGASYPPRGTKTAIEKVQKYLAARVSPPTRETPA